MVEISFHSRARVVWFFNEIGFGYYRKVVSFVMVTIKVKFIAPLEYGLKQAAQAFLVEAVNYLWTPFQNEG